MCEIWLFLFDVLAGRALGSESDHSRLESRCSYDDGTNWHFQRASSLLGPA